MQLSETDPNVNKVIYFQYKNGCIPANSFCFCYVKEGNYYWVSFREPILGMTDIKLHKAVIESHGVVVRDL